MSEQRDYKFSCDWFSGNIPIWQQHLGKLAERPCRYLEVGVYEGRSATWCVENLLKHPESSAVFIDPFTGSTEHQLLALNFDQPIPPLQQVFEHNLSVSKEKSGFKNSRVIAGHSFAALNTLINEKQLFDLIYVDGDHKARSVLEDTILAFHLLESDGFMVLDDYTWDAFPDPLLCPRLGIDRFLEMYGRDVRVLHKGYQVIIQKF